METGHRTVERGREAHGGTVATDEEVLLDVVDGSTLAAQHHQVVFLIHADASDDLIARGGKQLECADGLGDTVLRRAAHAP